jgi:hypothetical protein
VCAARRPRAPPAAARRSQDSPRLLPTLECVRSRSPESRRSWGGRSLLQTLRAQ